MGCSLTYFEDEYLVHTYVLKDLRTRRCLVESQLDNDNSKKSSFGWIFFPTYPAIDVQYTQMNANEVTKGITMATELCHMTGVQGKGDFKATDEKSILKNGIWLRNVSGFLRCT